MCLKDVTSLYFPEEQGSYTVAGDRIPLIHSTIHLDADSGETMHTLYFFTARRCSDDPLIWMAMYVGLGMW